MNNIREWNIPKTKIVPQNNNGFYLYIKVPLAEGEDTSEILIDENIIAPGRDEGFMIHLWGYLTPVDALGKRSFIDYLAQKPTDPIKSSSNEI